MFCTIHSRPARLQWNSKILHFYAIHSFIWNVYDYVMLLFTMIYCNGAAVVRSLSTHSLFSVIKNSISHRVSLILQANSMSSQPSASSYLFYHNLRFYYVSISTILVAKLRCFCGKWCNWSVDVWIWTDNATFSCQWNLPFLLYFINRVSRLFRYSMIFKWTAKCSVNIQ